MLQAHRRSLADSVAVQSGHAGADEGRDEGSGLVPEDIPESAKAKDTIKRTLSNLAQITQASASCASTMVPGTAGRRAQGSVGASRPLAVNAAAAFVEFITATYRERASPCRSCLEAARRGAQPHRHI